MKPTNAKKVYVVIRRPRTAAPFLSLAKAILQAVSNAKTTFPTPNPTLATLTTDITSFDNAQSSALTRAKGAVQARNAAMSVVTADLELLRAYVQQVADADPSNALVIAHSAGMDLRKTAVRTTNDLNVKPGKTSGTLAVSARTGGVRSAHDWQLSSDGGKTWVSLPSSLQAKTTISGLTPLTTVMVRHRAVTKAGPQDWSQPITAAVQ